MRPVSHYPPPFSRYPVSSIGALERECLYMGWPSNPEEGREEVKRYLSDLGFAVQSPEAPLDLYAALNRIRSLSWEKGSEVWRRYVANRRAEVDAFNGTRRITVRLQRTVFAHGAASVSRIRVLLPFEHPAQGSLSWNLSSVSAGVVRELSGDGFLDLTLAEGAPQVTAEVTYSATVSPQSATTEGVESSPFIDGGAAPFVIPERIAAQLSNLSKVEDTRARVHELWKIFHHHLLSGHVYHNEYLTAEHDDGARSGWFDCVTGSWNICSVLQRCGIPSRVVGGLLLHRFGPSYHYWCEVAIEGGWFPLDLYAWDISDGDEMIRDRFFGALESRLRFECFPRTFSRFLPNVPWFMERSSEAGVGSYTYRRLDSGAALAQDRWCLASVEP
jgi:hypothetical protein